MAGGSRVREAALPREPHRPGQGLWRHRLLAEELRSRARQAAEAASRLRLLRSRGCGDCAQGFSPSSAVTAPRGNNPFQIALFLLELQKSTAG